MLPAFTLVGVGTRRRLWIPLPVLLLWPLWPVGWLAWLALWALRNDKRERWRLFLNGAAHLSGLRLHLETRSGQRIEVRVV